MAVKHPRAIKPRLVAGFRMIRKCQTCGFRKFKQTEKKVICIMCGRWVWKSNIRQKTTKFSPTDSECHIKSPEEITTLNSELTENNSNEGLNSFQNGYMLNSKSKKPKKLMEEYENETRL